MHRLSYLSGNCGVIGTNDDEIWSDVDSLRLDVDTCRYIPHGSAQ